MNLANDSYRFQWSKEGEKHIITLRTKLSHLTVVDVDGDLPSGYWRDLLVHGVLKTPNGFHLYYDPGVAYPAWGDQAYLSISASRGEWSERLFTSNGEPYELPTIGRPTRMMITHRIVFRMAQEHCARLGLNVPQPQPLDFSEIP